MTLITLSWPLLRLIYCNLALSKLTPKRKVESTTTREPQDPMEFVLGTAFLGIIAPVLVIPSEASNLALPRKQCEIPRFARNDTVISRFLGPAGGIGNFQLPSADCL